jgi:hypothetical protein
MSHMLLSRQDQASQEGRLFPKNLQLLAEHILVCTPMSECAGMDRIDTGRSPSVVGALPAP